MDSSSVRDFRSTLLDIDDSNTNNVEFDSSGLLWLADFANYLDR